MSRRLPIASVKAHFAECVRRVEGGETVILTRHGRPVARLTALAPGDAIEPADATEVRESPERYGVQRIPEATAAAGPTEASRRQGLQRLLEGFIWPRVPADQLGSGVPKKERNEILGYRSDGV